MGSAAADTIWAPWPPAPSPSSPADGRESPSAPGPRTRLRLPARRNRRRGLATQPTMTRFEEVSDGGGDDAHTRRGQLRVHRERQQATRSRLGDRLRAGRVPEALERVLTM